MVSSDSEDTLSDSEFIFISDEQGQISEMRVPSALDLHRPTRARTLFTEDQLMKLESEFKISGGYQTKEARNRLANKIGLSEKQVSILID